MDDVERLVQAEIDRLKGPGFAKTRRAREQRAATIRAVAKALLAKKPLTGDKGALGPARAAGVIAENTFYEKPHWHKHPQVQLVIDNVMAIYREQAMAEQEAAQQKNRVWVEQKEMEAAHTMFDKANDLLALPHLTRKTKRPKPGQEEKEEIIILDPANAAVFNAAVNLNRSASELARRALGLPTEVRRSELTGADGGPIQTRDGLDEVSDDELQRRIGTLARGALALLGGGAVAVDAAGAATDNSASEEGGYGDA